MSTISAGGTSKAQAATNVATTKSETDVLNQVILDNNGASSDIKSPSTHDHSTVTNSSPESTAVKEDSDNRETIESTLIEKILQISQDELRTILKKLMKHIDEKELLNLSEWIDNSQLQPTELPNRKLHLLSPNLKKEYLQGIIMNVKILDHAITDIDDFCTKLTFISAKKQDGVLQVSCYNQKQEEISFDSKKWEDDIWFKHLLKIQTAYAMTVEDGECGVFFLQNITYCMLIRYENDMKEINHQLYVGKDTTLERWSRSGKNHLANVRAILQMKNVDPSAAELALTYFGPENAIIFTIGPTYMEYPFANTFPSPSGEVINLTESPLGLNNILPPLKDLKAHADEIRNIYGDLAENFSL